MLVKIYQPMYASSARGPWYPLGSFTSLEEAEKVDLKGKGINGRDGYISVLNAVKVGEDYYILEDRYGVKPKALKGVK